MKKVSLKDQIIYTLSWRLMPLYLFLILMVPVILLNFFHFSSFNQFVIHISLTWSISLILLVLNCFVIVKNHDYTNYMIRKKEIEEYDNKKVIDKKREDYIKLSREEVKKFEKF